MRLRARRGPSLESAFFSWKFQLDAVGYSACLIAFFLIKNADILRLELASPAAFTHVKLTLKSISYAQIINAGLRPLLGDVDGNVGLFDIIQRTLLVA